MINEAPSPVTIAARTTYRGHVQTVLERLQLIENEHLLEAGLKLADIFLR
jgi:hypothetical protein